MMHSAALCRRMRHEGGGTGWAEVALVEAAEAAQEARKRLGDMFMRPPEAHVVLMARSCLGLSQEDVARLAGLSRDTVRRVERGEQVRPTSLLRVVDALLRAREARWRAGSAVDLLGSTDG